MSERKLFDFKLDAKVLLVAVAVAAAFYMFGTPVSRQAPVAVLTVDGKEVLHLALQSAEDQHLSLEATTGIAAALEVKGHRIRFVEVDCPDHICEQTGFIGKTGERAVCMPNRMILNVRPASEVKSSVMLSST